MNSLQIVLLSLLVLMALSALTSLGCGLKPVRRLGVFAPPFRDMQKAIAEARKEGKRRRKEQAKNGAPAADSSSESYVIDDFDEEPRIPAVQHTVDPSLLPSVAIVVYAFVNEELFTDYLDALMLQNYPDFEVVVVCDASAETASEMADRFMNRYTNLHLTFIPPGTHNLSRRKLAFTLGIKGAESDVVITTAANARIPSRDWLYSMMAPFAEPGVDVVLGVTKLDFNQFEGASRWYRQFDTVLSQASWISRAYIGKPYRGDAYNMAFRRSLFFEHNGYADTIGKPFGEDDVFLSKMADGTNTRVVLSPSTLLTMDWGAAAERVSTSVKEHHLFAGKMLVKGPRIRQALLGVTSWLTLLCGVAVIVLSLISSVSLLKGVSGAAIVPLLPWEGIGALVLLMLFWGLQIASYRRGCVSLEAVRLWWAVPVFLLWRPIGNIIFRYRHRKARFMDFIWNGYQ